MSTSRVVSAPIQPPGKAYTQDVLTISLNGKRGGNYCAAIEWDAARKLHREMGHAIRARDAETGYTDPGLRESIIAGREAKA